MGAEAPAGTGVIHMMPELSGLVPLEVRDHFVGGFAPGKRPVPSPRQPTGRSGDGIRFAVPSGDDDDTLMLVSAAVPRPHDPMSAAMTVASRMPTPEHGAWYDECRAG
jgi:hypothetical protein